jgi:hypothetical protein
LITGSFAVPLTDDFYRFDEGLFEIRGAWLERVEARIGAQADEVQIRGDRSCRSDGWLARATAIRTYVRGRVSPRRRRCPVRARLQRFLDPS